MTPSYMYVCSIYGHNMCVCTFVSMSPCLHVPMSVCITITAVFMIDGG